MIRIVPCYTPPTPTGELERTLAANKSSTLPRQVMICGAILTIGYIGVFCLLQSQAFWYDLRPDPVRSLVAEFFGPINAAFPQGWVNLERTDSIALVAVPIYLLVAALIIVPYLYILRTISQDKTGDAAPRKPVLRRIFGWTVLIMLVLLFERGLFSSDIYNYAWYSRIWIDHGVSPYTHAPIEFPPDPEGSIYWIGWPKEFAVYGPAWMLVSSVPHYLSRLIGGNFSAQVLALRLLADAAHLLNALLIWSIMGLILARGKHEAIRLQPSRFQVRLRRIPSLRHLRNRLADKSHRLEKKATADGYPATQLAALIFYIWNALVLVEFAGSGHNDVLMLTFVLLAVWLHLKGQWPLASVALGLAALVKLPALLFVPGYLWFILWDRDESSRKEQVKSRLPTGIGRTLKAAGLILLTWVVLYLPFWEGPSTLEPLFTGPANRLYMHTLAADVRTNGPQIVANLQGISENRDQYIVTVQQFLDANLRLWLMGIVGVVALLVTWRARSFSGMAAAWGWVMMATIMTQGWFWPWYVTWMIVPATIAQSRRLLVTALIFSISSLFLYLEEQILGQHYSFFLDWSGLLVMGPPLAYLACSALLELGRKQRPSSISYVGRARTRTANNLNEAERAR